MLLPPEWNASPSQGYPTALNYTPVRVKCLVEEHNTMSLARARTRTAPYGDERTNHETTAKYYRYLCISKHYCLRLFNKFNKLNKI